MDHAFKINLRGIIDLLSQHLYSGPQVFLRELLQNATDALRARAQYDPDHRGEITIEVLGGPVPSLAFLDDGIGLTEDEVHRFLATIGQTSKREAEWERPEDFIGRFGIGLLSCFVVSDEIAVITRSARPGDQKTIEWRGRPDGTYTIKTIDREIEPGTQVYLTCKRGSEPFFTPEKVRELAAHFGGLLPHPIRVVAGKDSRVINESTAPWRRRFASTDEQTRELLAYGRLAFGTEFLDAIPLKSRVGGVDGVAFVLPYSPSLASKRTNRVYLKGMLLSEDAEGLLPNWAFFVKCIVNADALRPTASREAFYEDDDLEATREALGNVLRDYLVGLAARDPAKLQKLIALHDLSIKGLALHDDDFYRLFIDWLRFETSMGTMTLGEYREQFGTVLYVPDLDRFRQVARVASAQGICLINAAYTHDADLLARLPFVVEGAESEAVDPASLTQTLEDLSIEDRDEIFPLIALADRVLQPFKCSAEAKRFLPEELPTLYSTAKDAEFRRSLERSKEVADPLWSSVLESMLGDDEVSAPYAQLTFNGRNPLVRKIARIDRPDAPETVDRDALRPGPPARPSPAERPRDGAPERRPDRPDRMGAEHPGRGWAVSQDVAGRVRELTESARRAGTGPTRVMLYEEAVRVADSHGEVRLGWSTRLSLIEAAVFAEESEKTLAPLAWCLAQSDRDPLNYRESDLLWRIKWVVDHARLLARVPRSRLEALLDDMEYRFLRQGASFRAVWRTRFKHARSRGDREAARLYYNRWNQTPRDSFADCLACEQDGRVDFLAFDGRDAEALEAATPILDGRMRCAEIPLGTYGTVLLPLVRPAASRRP